MENFLSLFGSVYLSGCAIFVFLLDLYPNNFKAFTYNNLPENEPGSYYVENPGANPTTRTEPNSKDNSRVTTYTVTYHGDFAIEECVEEEFYTGRFGWINGKFYDERDGFQKVETTTIYYKGEYLECLRRKASYFTGANYDDRSSMTFYCFEHDGLGSKTKGVIFKVQDGRMKGHRKLKNNA